MFRQAYRGEKCRLPTFQRTSQQFLISVDDWDAQSWLIRQHLTKKQNNGDFGLSVHPDYITDQFFHPFLKYFCFPLCPPLFLYLQDPLFFVILRNENLILL